MSTNQELLESQDSNPDSSRPQGFQDGSKEIQKPGSKGGQLGKVLQRRQQRRAQLGISSNQQDKREV